VTFNVNSTGTAQVGIVNDDGNFTGPAHESDPGAKIDWLPPEHTLVSAYTSSAAVHRTEIRVATTNEFDVQQFHVLRSESASGPFAEIVGSPFPPTGSPVLGANYSKTDFATVDTTKYFYRLEEELTHGLRRVLADDFARPWPQQVANAWFVGTNGGYPDIATAVAAAPPGASILVQAGTYPSFTLNKSVRIAPDGSGPVVIDTTLAKMVIRDIAVGAPDLGLYDVSVGSPTSPFGMEIVNCDNIIVLDGLQVAAGTGVVGLLVDDSRQVALQNCTITGDPGLKFDNNALAYLSRGSVDELVLAGLSDVTRCGVVPTTQQVGVGSVVHALTGTMPNVSSRAAWPGDKPVSLTITTDPNSFYALFYSFGRDFFDLGAVFPSLDMALLIEQTQAQMLTFNLSVSGTEQIVLPAPSNPFSWGLAIPYQVFDLKQPSNLGRAGNSRAAFLLP